MVSLTGSDVPVERSKRSIVRELRIEIKAHEIGRFHRRFYGKKAKSLSCRDSRNFADRISINATADAGNATVLRLLLRTILNTDQ